MRRSFICIMIMISLVYILSGYGQDLSIRDFRVPEHKVFRIPLFVNLHKWYYYDDLSYDVGLIPHYRSISDTREFDARAYISAGRSYEMTDYIFETFVGIRHYLSTFFLHGQVDFNSWNGYYFHDEPSFWRKVRYGDLEIGCGIGHLREGYFASVALHINEILKEEDIIGEDLSKSTLLEIAQLIAKKQAYIIKNDRYEKYMFSELQKIIEGDPACENSVSAYALFRIFDIVDRVYPGMSDDVVYWNRQFGTRLSFDLLGTHITDLSQIYGNNRRMLNFPLFDSVYYVPGIKALFEYGNPLSLKSHITFSTAYQIDWYDSVTSHDICTNITYARGVIDRIVFTAMTNIDYYHTVPQDTTAHGLCVINPEIGLAYYIEDRIRLGVEVGYDVDIEVEYSDPNGFEIEHGIMFDVNTRWYLF